MGTTTGYVKASNKQAYAEVFAADDAVSDFMIVTAAKRASTAKADNLYVCYHSPGKVGRIEKRTYNDREVTIVCLPVLPD